MKGRPFHPCRSYVGQGAFLCVFLAMFLVSVPWEPLCRAADQGSQASKTIVDLQPFRQTGSIPIKSSRGEEGRATLINLNPDINDWYLLQLNWGNRAPA